MNVHSIPGKLTVKLRSDVKAIVDTWQSYNVTLEEFKDAVFEKGIKAAKRSGCKAWIVDSSAADGSFAPEIQNFIGKEVFPLFAQNGIDYFITINSEKSALTRISSNMFKAKTGPNGLKLVEADNLNNAINWLKQNS